MLSTVSVNADRFQAVYLSFSNHFPARPSVSAVRRVPANRGFALILTLLILCLLIIVVVSYLSSMSAELQTSGAFTAKVRAAQAAQAAVDSATTMLAESFRDYPDSATVWDAKQTINTGTPANNNVNIVSGVPNEGTTLYFRAVPKTDGTTPDPKFTGKNSAANDPSGNNPNNAACQTFVLPLVSGVPNGQARLASSKASIWPTTMQMNLAEPDPAKQNWAELNVRRTSSDIQGVIGSPPGWTGVPSGGAGKGPKPARAYWVNQTGSDGRLVGRYAFWMEDNSFRANLNQIDNASQVRKESGPPPMVRVDNTTQPLDGSGNPRTLLPSDMFLLGMLTAIDPTTASSNALPLLTVRNNYPGSYLPEAHAFAHADLKVPQYADIEADGTLTPAQKQAAEQTRYADQIGYASTAQSGTLNLTRHGTQRMNLDAIITPPAPGADLSLPASQDTIKNRLQQIVRTIAFHLPNFGQRFYRTATDFSAATLNNATQVSPGAPLPLSTVLEPSSAGSSNHALIYLYKIATNIHDYIDGSTQPTIVLSGGTLPPPALPSGPPDEGSPSIYWAQGKKIAPFIDEVAVRYRPLVAPSKANPDFAFVHSHFDFCIDYYVEVWNMSDRDVYAMPQADKTLPHLSGARLAVRTQQQWTVYGGGVMIPDPMYPDLSEPLMPPGQSPYSDALLLDLTSGTFGFDSGFNQIPLDGTHAITTADGRTLKPNGIVFPAGCVTVLTSDPSCFLSTNSPRYPADTRIAKDTVTAYGPLALPANSPSLKPVTTPNPLATFYCSNILPDPSNNNLKGQRHYSGRIVSPSGGIVTAGGVQFVINSGANFVGDISLENGFGYIDFARSSIVESGSTPYTNTATQVTKAPPSFNDFSYSSGLAGNAKDISSPAPPNAPAPMASELGDPRTNNEQLNTTPFTNLSASGNADQSRYFASNATLGYINNAALQPDGTNVPSTSGSAWPDYYTNGGQTPASGVFPNPGIVNAPMMMARAPLTSIGQLGDIFDPARLPGAGSVVTLSRGGGRTLKIGQHDDRYDPTPPDYNAGAASPAPASIGEAPSASNSWAAWRLTDIFSAYLLANAQTSEPIEFPGRININGITRDNGAALRAALTGFNFQPVTGSDPMVHGDGHAAATGFQSLAGTALNLDGPAASSGLPELVSAVKKRLDPSAIYAASGSTSPIPYGPFFERGELGELVGDNGQFIFGAASGTSPYVTSTQANTDLLNNVSPAAKVDMNKTYDRGREELFRRLSELICTRGDTFTVYVIGESLTPSISASGTPKVTGTHRMRVTFRLTPVDASGNPFHPTYDQSGAPISNNSLATLDDINKRFVKPDHYSVQVLETATY